MQKCYKCDLQFKDDKVRFCPYCGSPLAIDKEWAEKQRKLEEERLREEEEKRQELKRLELWNQKCKDHIEKQRELTKRLRKYDFTTFKYKDLVKYLISKYRFTYNHYGDFIGVKDEDELKRLIDTNNEVSLALDLLDGNVVSANFNGIKNLIDTKYKEFKVNVDELKFYNKNAGFSKFFIDFCDYFNNGGKFKYEEKTIKAETNDFIKAQERGEYVTSVKGTEVSYLSIPHNDKVKYHIISESEYASKFGWDSVDMKYYRFNIYEDVTTTISYYDFGLKGYLGNIQSLYYNKIGVIDTLIIIQI